MAVKQSIVGNEVKNMSDEKKYSAKDAAVAVLNKAQEMLKSHALKKAEEAIPHKASQEKDATHPDGVEQTPAPAPTDINPKVNGNPEWGTTPGVVKGHIKLAKFAGHMQAKRKMAKPGVPNV